MKKIILIALAGILFGGCYTQIGTIKEDEGYSTSQSEKEYRDYSNYNYDYNYDAWYYSRYIYRYYLPYNTNHSVRNFIFKANLFKLF